MAYTPTQLDFGLPKNYHYTDIKIGGTVDNYVGAYYPYDSIVAINPSDVNHKYGGKIYVRGLYHHKRWSLLNLAFFDTTANRWKMHNIENVKYNFHYIYPQYSGTKYFDNLEFLAAYSGNLFDGLTAYSMPLTSKDMNSLLYFKCLNVYRYDTDLPNMPDGQTGVWRLNNFTKAQDYDWLPPAQSGFNYDVCVPYTRGALTVGTKATAYGYCVGGELYGEWLDNGVDEELCIPKEASRLGSLGIQYTCTQVEPVHVWTLG